MPRKKRKDRFHRIKQLRCFDRVHDMLCYGYPAPEVAKFIKSQGEYNTANVRSLAETLKRYRRKEILPSDVLARRRPDIIIEAKKAYSDKLEELRQLELLLNGTLYRYDLQSAREMESGAYDQAVDRIGKEVRDILRTMHGIKMDLGISGQRQLGTLNLSAERIDEIKEKYGSGPAKVMADPVSRARVIAYMRAAEDAALLKAREDDRARMLEERVIDAELVSE